MSGQNGIGQTRINNFAHHIVIIIVNIKDDEY